MHDEGRESETRLKINKPVTETTRKEKNLFSIRTKESEPFLRQPGGERALRYAARRGQSPASNQGQGRGTEGRDPLPRGAEPPPAPDSPSPATSGARPLLSAAAARACAGPGQPRRRPRSPHSGAAGSCWSRWCRRSSLGWR